MAKEKLKDNIRLSILDIKNMLNAIIIDAKKINFENADIFFVNKEQFNKICALYLSAESLFLNDKDNDKLTVNTNRRGTIKKKKDPFYNVAKILYDKSPIIAYKTFLKHKYVNITDEEKVKGKINVDHLIEINEIKKFYDELIAEKKDEFDDNMITKLREEEKDKINHVVKMKDFLTNEFKFLDIRITTFRDNTLYPTIKMIDAEGKDAQEYLRLEVPNILYVHKNIFLLEPGYRKDASHIKFVLSAEHAFGQIYFKWRKNNGKDSRE